MDWFRSAVDKTLRCWEDYGHVGDYKFDTYVILSKNSESDIRSLVGDSFRGSSPVRTASASLESKNKENTGAVRFKLYTSPMAMEVSVVVWGGDMDAPKLSTSNMFELDPEDLMALEKGECDTMIASVVTFLLHGQSYYVVT